MNVIVQYTDSEASCNFTVSEKAAEGTDNDTEKPAEGTDNDTEKPAEGTDNDTEKPAEGADNDTQTLQTGDNSNIILWIVLLLLSGGALSGTLIFTKKRFSKR